MTRRLAVGFILTLVVGLTTAHSLIVSAAEEVVPAEPAITTPSMPDGAVGEQYSHALQASSANQVTYRIEEGILPPGLVISDDGIISGAPDAAGTYGFRVSANNENASGESAWFAITIQPINESVDTPAPVHVDTNVNNDDSVTEDSGFIGAPSAQDSTNADTSVVQGSGSLSSPAPGSSRNFGTVPQTGIPDVSRVAVAMGVCIIISSISWASVFRIKSRNRKR